MGVSAMEMESPNGGWLYLGVVGRYLRYLIHTFSTPNRRSHN